MVLSIFAGGPNTIRAQQAAMQAAKKVTGNTFTAMAQPANTALTAWIILAGCYFIPTGFHKLYYGYGKKEIKED